MEEQIDWTSPFRPEDFPQIELRQCHAVELANRRFREIIENSPVVYAKHKPGWPDTEWQETKWPTDLFQARLICIELIK